MKTPMHTMEEIILGMSLRANPQSKELLKMSADILRTMEARMVKEAFEKGRNSIKGSDHEISKRKAGEYYNNKFKV